MIFMFSRRGTKKRQRFQRFKGYAQIVGGVGALASVGVAWWLEYPQILYAKTINLCVEGAQNAGFRLNDLVVYGRRHAPVESVLKAVSLQQDDAIFKRSPIEIQESLHEIPWVLSASVVRQLPSKLYVYITERTPIAVWQHQKTHYLVDVNGVIISNDKLGDFGKLPIIVGGDAPMHAPKMLHVINEFPEIKSRVSALIRVGGRRWDLQLDQKITVKLPEEKPETALSRLLVLLRQRKIGPGDVSTIDLRLPTQIILRLSPLGEVKVTGKGQEA